MNGAPGTRLNAGANGLFPLYGLEIFQQIFHPDISEVFVVFDLMKDRSPDRHRPGPMGGRGVSPLDRLAQKSGGKLTLVVLCQDRQIRYLLLQLRRHGAIPMPSRTVANSTVRAIQIRTFYRIDEWLGFWRCLGFHACANRRSDHQSRSQGDR